MGVSLYLYITFLLFWPYVPMTIHSIKIINPGNVVYAGGELIYEVDYTKEKTYPVTQVTRQLIDGYVITLANVRGSSLPCGRHQKQIRLQIPANSGVGDYTMHLSATYQVNHLRTVTVIANSLKFEIRKM